MLLNLRDKLNSTKPIFTLCSFQYRWLFWIHNECMLYYDNLLIQIFDSPELLPNIIDWRTFIVKCVFFLPVDYIPRWFFFLFFKCWRGQYDFLEHFNSAVSQLKPRLRGPHFVTLFVICIRTIDSSPFTRHAQRQAYYDLVVN